MALKRSFRIAALVLSFSVVTSMALGTVIRQGSDLDAFAEGDVRAPKTTAPQETAPSDGPKKKPQKRLAPVRLPKPIQCRNSYNPKCGPFYWSPAPGPNAPIDLEVTYSPANPTVGEEIIFAIKAIDPDANEIAAYPTGFGGPGSGDGVLIPPLCIGPEPAGPWTPPVKKTGQITRMATFTYSAAGSFTATFLADSGTNSCQAPNPYASDQAVSVTLVVSPTAPPSPSPEASTN